MNVIIILFLIVLTSLCDTVSQLFLKGSINAMEPNVSSLKKIFSFIIRLILTPKVWLTGIFSLLSLFIWLFVLSKADLNFAFSADSMHYIFIALSSRIFLKEKVGTSRWIGTLCIVIGIVMITWSNR